MVSVRPLCDDAHVSGSRVVQVFLAVAGIALGVVAYQAQVDNLGPYTSPSHALAIVAVGWSFLLAGIVAWSRRSGNRVGPLMIAAGFALLLRQLRYSHDELVFTVFFALGHLPYALVPHSVLAYPSGRVTDRFERALVTVGYAVVLAFPLAILLFYDATRPLIEYPTARESLLLIVGAPEVADALQKAFVVVFYGILATLFIVVIARRLVRATPRARRILAPLLLAAIAVAFARYSNASSPSSTSRSPATTCSGGRSSPSSPSRSRCSRACSARGSRGCTSESSSSSSSGLRPTGSATRWRTRSRIRRSRSVSGFPSGPSTSPRPGRRSRCPTTEAAER